MSTGDLYHQLTLSRILKSLEMQAVPTTVFWWFHPLPLTKKYAVDLIYCGNLVKQSVVRCKATLLPTASGTVDHFRSAENLPG